MIMPSQSCAILPCDTGLALCSGKLALTVGQLLNFLSNPAHRAQPWPGTERVLAHCCCKILTDGHSSSQIAYCDLVASDRRPGLRYMATMDMLLSAAASPVRGLRPLPSRSTKPTPARRATRAAATGEARNIAVALHRDSAQQSWACRAGPVPKVQSAGHRTRSEDVSGARV